MRIINQILIVALVNLKSLPKRIGRSMVIVVGIAGVVVVFVSAISMSTGILESMQSAGRSDRVIILREGSLSEIASALTLTDAVKIFDKPGIKRSADGAPIASSEIVSVVSLGVVDGKEVRIPLRGCSSNIFQLRPEIEIVEGRMFREGVYEMVVGKSASSIYGELNVDDEVEIFGTTWRIVGVFSSNDIHESELITNIGVLQSAMNREDRIQAVTVMLDSENSFEELSESLDQDPNLNVNALREDEYYASQSKSVTEILTTIAYLIGGIMALGAFFAALNTMYSAISDRSKEIAILRAIGFNSASIVVSVLLEALVLSLLGGVIGAFGAWLLFNGYTTNSNLGGLAGESRVFSIRVTMEVALLGILWSSAIGFLGGLFPSIKAANDPVTVGLRESR